MLIRSFDRNKKGIRASAKLLAASVACANVSLAYPQSFENNGPVDILPLIFTPLGAPGISNAPPAEQFVTTIEPLVVVRNRSKENPTPENDEDLDLAIENFFYALDDLIQSANRRTEATERANAYALQVELPTTVVTPVDSVPLPAAPEPVTLPPTIAEVTPADTDTVFDNFDFSSQLNFGIEQNSNIYTTRTNQVSDQIATFNGSAGLESKTRKASLQLEGNVSSGNYLDNSNNNYIDFSTAATFSTLLSQRSKAIVSATYLATHEEVGQEVTTDEVETRGLSRPIEFSSVVLRGLYERGTTRTRSRFTADARVNQLRTSNYQEIDFVQQRDRDLNSLIGTAFYNLSQRMSVLVEVRHQDVQYQNERTSGSSDSTQTRYAIGAEWLATRKTAGSVRIGIQEKDFDDIANNDSQGISWDAIIEWTPTPRTEMLFETSSDISETETFGVARESTDYKITWKQRWAPRLNSTASGQYTSIDYQQGETPREDGLTLINAELNYSVNTDTDASLKLTYMDNSSNVIEYDFDRSQIQLGLKMEF